MYKARKSREADKTYVKGYRKDTWVLKKNKKCAVIGAQNEHNLG